jgi:hypothetical protein
VPNLKKFVLILSLVLVVLLTGCANSATNGNTAATSNTVVDAQHNITKDYLNALAAEGVLDIEKTYGLVLYQVTGIEYGITSNGACVETLSINVSDTNLSSHPHTFFVIDNISLLNGAISGGQVGYSQYGNISVGESGSFSVTQAPNYSYTGYLDQNVVTSKTNVGSNDLALQILKHTNPDLITSSTSNSNSKSDSQAVLPSPNTDSNSIISTNTISVTGDSSQVLKTMSVGELADLSFTVNNIGTNDLNGFKIKIKSNLSSITFKADPWCGDVQNGLTWNLTDQLPIGDNITKGINFTCGKPGNYTLLFWFYASNGVTPLYDSSGHQAGESISFSIINKSSGSGNITFPSETPQQQATDESTISNEAENSNKNSYVSVTMDTSNISGLLSTRYVGDDINLGFSVMTYLETNLSDAKVKIQGNTDGITFAPDPDSGSINRLIWDMPVNANDDIIDMVCSKVGNYKLTFSFYNPDGKTPLYGQDGKPIVESVNFKVASAPNSSQ